MMLESWFLELRNLTSIFLIVAITLDVLNRDQLKPWIKSYLPLLIFGFFASVSVNFSLQNSLIVLWTYLLILTWFLMLNRKRIGLNLSILGSILNLLVVVINGGRMPIPVGWAEEDAAYQFVTPETLLPFLSDCILIGNVMFSIGDICLHIGALIFLLCQIGIFLKKKFKDKN